MKSSVFQFIAAFLMIVGNSFGQNPRIHIIEDGTFNACGHCPCNDSVIRHNVIPRVPNTVFIRYHWPWSALHSVGCDTLLRNLSVNQTAFNVDRNGVIYVEPEYVKGYSHLCDIIVADLQKEPQAPLKITLKSKNYNSQTREFTFSADFVPYQADMNGTFMVNAVITENKILFEQAFLDSCGKDPQGKYIIRHNDVARKQAYTPFGDQLKAGAWSQTETITRNFTLKLDSSWIPQNCEFTVYVYNMADSMYRSKIQQASREAVTSPLGVENKIPGLVVITVFPVPAKEEVNAHLSFPANGIATVSISDQNGRIVKDFRPLRVEKDEYNYEFTVKGFAPGIYFIRVTMDGKTFSQRFLVRD
jgi:hypothetical protein